MGPITIGFGLALTLLGAGGYWMTRAPTALIPAGFGIVLLVLGVLAGKEHLRKHVMHAAAMLGLVGFLAAALRAIPKLPELISTGQVLNADGIDIQRAVILQSVMAVFCAVFLALCVNSFIQARRRRAAAQQGDVR